MEMLWAEKCVGVWNTWGQHIWVIKRGCCGCKPVFAKPKDGCRWTEANFDTVHHRSFVKIVRMEDGKFNISPTQSTLQQHSRMRLSETAAGTGGRLASVLPLHSWSVDDFVHGRRCLHSRAGFSRESGGCRQQSRRWQRQQSMQCLRHWSAIRSRS